MDPMDPDLSLVSEDDLLYELYARYENAAFVGMYHNYGLTYLRIKRAPDTDFGVAHLILNTALDEVERFIEDGAIDMRDDEVEWEDDDEDE